MRESGKESEVEIELKLVQITVQGTETELIAVQLCPILPHSRKAAAIRSNKFICTVEILLIIWVMCQTFELDNEL